MAPSKPKLPVVNLAREHTILLGYGTRDFAGKRSLLMNNLVVHLRFGLCGKIRSPTHPLDRFPGRGQFVKIERFTLCNKDYMYLAAARIDPPYRRRSLKKCFSP